MSAHPTVQALVFDVFGTVTDWRASVIREGEALGREKGLEVDWGRFADDWRRDGCTAWRRASWAWSAPR